MFAEPRHPRLGDYALAHTREFSVIISRADALKNAPDHLNSEWKGKPVGLVSCGGVAAGARAAVALEPVLIALGMHPAAFAPIPFVMQFIEGAGDQRRFVPNAEVEKGVTDMLDTLSAALGTSG